MLKQLGDNLRISREQRFSPGNLATFSVRSKHYGEEYHVGLTCFGFVDGHQWVMLWGFRIGEGLRCFECDLLVKQRHKYPCFDGHPEGCCLLKE